MFGIKKRFVDFYTYTQALSTDHVYKLYSTVLYVYCKAWCMWCAITLQLWLQPNYATPYGSGSSTQILNEPEPQRDAAPVLMATPQNLIIKKFCNIVGAGAASKFLPGARAALKWCGSTLLLSRSWKMWQAIFVSKYVISGIRNLFLHIFQTVNWKTVPEFSVMLDFSKMR
jgi:hypothetical protein